jgi:hypothetical protein
VVDSQEELGMMELLINYNRNYSPNIFEKVNPFGVTKRKDEH